MKNCTRETKTNGQRSKLYDKLFEITQDESMANSLYSYFDLNEFNKKFIRKDKNGNFKTPLELPELYGNAIDDNFEPKLHYNSKLNKYYYLDNMNEPVFYPNTRQGLEKELNKNQIKKFAKSIALKYFFTNFKFSKETFEFERIDTQKLKEFIKTFIDYKISELDNSDELEHNFIATSLDKTKDYLDEWYDEVTSFYNTLKLDVVEEEVQEMEQQAEDFRGELIRVESFLKSSKTNVSENIKLFLSLIPSLEKNEFNEYEFVKFDDIWKTLNTSLWGIVAVHNEQGLEDEFELYLDVIKNLAIRKPYLNTLVANLQNVDDIFKNQFVKAFKLTKNNFLTSEFTKDDNILIHNVLNVSDVNSLADNLLKQWSFNFKQKIQNDTQLKNVKEEFKKGYSIVSKLLKDVKTEQDLVPLIKKLIGDLNKIGIVLGETQDGIDYFLDNQSTPKSLEERSQQILKTYQNILQSIDRYLENKVDDLLKDQSIFKDLAKSESFFLKDGSDASVFSLGKSKWVYSLPSYLEMKLNHWKKDPRLLQKHYEQTPFNNSSHWMEYLLALDVENLTEEERLEESKRRLNNVEIGIFNAVQEKNNSLEGSDNTSISYVDALADYVNKILAFKKGSKVWHKTALAADKSTEYQIHFGNDSSYFNLTTNARYSNNKIIVNDEVLEVFYKYFKGEYQRMYAERQFVKNNPSKAKPNYHLGSQNAFKSQLFPSLSYDKINSNQLGIRLYDIDGTPLLKDLDGFNNKNKEIIKEHISNIISTNIENTFKTLIENDLFTYDKNGVRQNNSLDNTIFSNYLKDSNQNTNNAILKIAGDLFVNSVISQVEYSKMFTGDVAYYKNQIDYKKRVPETYTDGQYMRLSSGEEYFNIAVIDSIEISAIYKDKLIELVGKEIADKYDKINAADAQAWITPERWMFINKRIGKWSKTHESVYKKMNSLENEKFSEKELKLLGQPLKGVYFDVVNGTPVFLKYSQAVLWKPLIKGTQLETLSEKMTKGDYENQIHEVITKDGIKVGYLQPSKIHNTKGEVVKNFKLEPMQLTNAYWKLQQDLPVKGFKQTDVGSQIQKIIFQGLVYNQDNSFYINDKEIKGSELIQYLHNLMSDLSNKGLSKVFNKLGLNPETLKVEDESVMYESLIDQLKKRKDVPVNFIKSLEANTSPYGIPGSLDMFQNVFSSLINNNTIKIKTNGGGFIQMSDFGIGKTDLSNQNIIFTPWMNTEKLPMPEFYTDSETGRKRIKPGGVFISGSLIAKYIPNYKEYKNNPEKLFGTLNPQTGKYEGGIIDSEILQNIIGYRIPNQGLPSNDAFQIMGILPEAVGDTIIPYTGITTKTGSDFDIDKMYLMIPSIRPIRNNIIKILKDTGLTENIAKKILVSQGITPMLDSNPILEMYDYLTLRNEFDGLQGDLKKLIETVQEKIENEPVIKLEYIKPKLNKQGQELDLSLQSEAVVQNKLIEAFKAVLTSEHVIKDIMSPLDIEYISNDIKNMFPEEERNDMMHFDAISDLNLKFEFMLGKAGLGQNVNSLVDAVRGAMSELTMMGVTTPFSKNKNNITFDKKMSFKLSEQDIKDYVKSFNENESDIKKHIKEKDVKKLQEIKLFDAMMALVNGFVDIAKDPYIVRGNWVTQTNNIGFFMLRSGTHPFYVNAFLGQPVLKEYVKFVSNKESKIVDDSSNLIPKFIIKKMSEIVGDERININTYIYSKQLLVNSLFDSNIISKLMKFKEKNNIKNYTSTKKAFEDNLLKDLATKFKTTKQDPEIISLHSELMNVYNSVIESNTTKTLDDLSLNDLRQNIFNSKKNNFKLSAEDVQTQLVILNAFQKFKEHSKELSKSVNSAKIDVNGKGKNITSLFIAKNLMNSLLDGDGQLEKISGGLSKLQKENNTTFLNTYYNNSILTAYQIMKANPKYFLTASNEVENTFNIVSNLLYGTDLLDEKLGVILEKNYYSYVMSNFEPLKLTSEQKNKLLFELPNQLQDIKKKYPDNLLLQKLYNKEGDLKKSYISMSDGKFSTAEKNDLTDSWSELLEFETNFAEDLIKYSYLITGFNNNINQFHEFIPYEWFNSKRFNSYLKSLELNEDFDKAFIDQFFKNNSDNQKLVRKVYLRNTLKLDSTTPSYIGFKLDKVGEHDGYLVKVESFDQFSQQTTTSFYKFQGFDIDNHPVYLRVSILGNKDSKGNKIVEYSFKNTNFKSDLEKNNVKNINAEIYTRHLNNPNIVLNYINSEQTLVTSESVLNEKPEIKINTLELFNNNKDLFENAGFNLEFINNMIETKGEVFTNNFLTNYKNSVTFNKLENTIETKQEVKSEVSNITESQQLSLFDNLQESKTMLNLKEMFNNGLMLNKFNESEINNVDDLNKLSEDELGELLEKICK